MATTGLTTVSVPKTRGASSPRILQRLEDAAHYGFQDFDYRLLQPAIARLPLRVGQAVADARGCVNALFDLDWRSLYLRRRYVRTATFRAMRRLVPDRGRWTWAAKTVLRFVHMAREEWLAAVGHERSLQFLVDCSDLKGIEPLLQAQRAGRGIVLLSCHYGSLPAGIVLLGLSGLRVNFLASAVVELPTVHPAITDFYRRKYRGFERHMNGGRVVYFERSPRYFYRALQRGEAVIVLGDLRSKGKRALDVPFFGAARRMAQGPVRMAQRTGSLLSAYLCHHEPGGRYSLECAPLIDISADPSKAAELYAFLEARILQRPEQWWAADLLHSYDEVD